MADVQQDASVQKSDDRTWQQRFNDYMVNDGPKLVFIILWICGNAALLIQTYVYYTTVRAPLYAILGSGLVAARSGAAIVKLNTALLFVMVLRNFLSWVRGTWMGDFLPLDKNIIFHRYIAWTVAAGAALHIVAHMYNFNTFQNADAQQLNTVLGLTKVPTAEQLFWTSLPGATGIVATLALILMYSCAIRYIRSPMFNLFWYTHHLFIVYVIMICIHGASQLLGDKPSFWYYVIGPIFLYAIERTVRLIRGNQDTILQLAIAHPSKVIELQMKKSTFKYKPGQYLFLNCPYIAAQEWHPFTITSCPEEDFVSVHIRIVGDWTGDLYNFLNPQKKLGVIQENLLTAPDGAPIFRIDGPFGAASEEFTNFKTVVLVGGGIGVTPFASILKNVRYRLEKEGNVNLERVYFYWVSRDKNAFEWFSDLLSALEQAGVTEFLEINTYLTAPMSAEEIRNVMRQADAEYDQITGLQSRTHFGRPNWDQIFEEKATYHKGSTVGVFFCGPAVLSKQLYKCCRKFTDSTTKTYFKYHKENF